MDLCVFRASCMQCESHTYNNEGKKKKKLEGKKKKLNR